MASQRAPGSADPPLPPVLISACLLGLPVRYDGTSLRNVSLPEDFAGRLLIPICPEQLGGLPTPRPRQELRNGSGHDVLEGKAAVINDEGIEVTENFLRGAQIACRIARLTGATEALLKDGSPSCGVTRITMDAHKCGGLGVTAAALEKMGIVIHACD